MKAFLLAAGKGTRLGPYTDRRPKCLVPIHGIPLLKIWIDLLARHGVSDVLINTHHHADQVADFLSRVRPLTAMQLHTVHEPALLGSAGTILRNRAFVQGDDNFIIAYADNLTNLNWSRMLSFHLRVQNHGGILTMGLIRSTNPRACGIVTLDRSGKITRFVEKPNHPDSDLANAGVYLAGSRIFNFMAEDISGQDSVLDLGHHILPRLTGRMYGYAIAPDYLKDIGTPEAYAQALRQWPRLTGTPTDKIPNSRG